MADLIHHGIAIPSQQVREFCRRHHIRRLALFGSILRDDFGPDSDIDVLVEFEPEHTPGFFFFALQDDLTAMFGRKVDLNTPGFLSDALRARVLAESETVYVAA